MIVQEAKLLCTALQFLTRLPAPQFADFEPGWLDRSAKYFPLVGLLVGAICAAGLLAATQIWSGALAALFAIAVGLLITGAFHEDGLADFFDSLGGSTREARLAIMKDSRVGTYGVLALIVALSAKVIALASMPLSTAVAALIAAHAGGRFAAVIGVATMPYAGDPSAAKVRPLGKNGHAVGLLLGLLFGLAPIALLPGLESAAGLAFAALLAVSIALLAQRMLGGITGDALGAIEQAYEVGFLLGIAACV